MPALGLDVRVEHDPVVQTYTPDDVAGVARSMLHPPFVARRLPAPAAHTGAVLDGEIGRDIESACNSSEIVAA